MPLSSNVSGGISSELALPFLYASGDDLHILEFQWLPYQYRLPPASSPAAVKSSDLTFYQLTQFVWESQLSSGGMPECSARGPGIESCGEDRAGGYSLLSLMLSLMLLVSGDSVVFDEIFSDSRRSILHQRTPRQTPRVTTYVIHNCNVNSLARAQHSDGSLYYFLETLF